MDKYDYFSSIMNGVKVYGKTFIQGVTSPIGVIKGKGPYCIGDRSFCFTSKKVSKGLDMKGGSEFGLALGVGALCKAAIGQLL
jgi:hypothetical protein